MRPGPFPPSPMRALDDLIGRVADRERREQTGVGVSTAFGARESRPVQVGFPCELTSGWSESTGYSWKQLVLSGVTVGDPALQRSGDFAATPDNNTALTAGTRGWLELDAQAGGWIFIADGPSGPPEPEEDNVPSTTSSGDLQTTPLYVVTGTLNGDPTAQLYLYTTPAPTTATPAISLLTVADSDGSPTPSESVVFYPAGTAGTVPVRWDVTTTSSKLTGAAAVTLLTFQAHASQSADLAVWESSGGTDYLRVTQDGYLVISQTAAPADARLANSQFALFLDGTDVKARLKDSGGSASTVTLGASGSGLSWQLIGSVTHASLTDTDLEQVVTVANLAAKTGILALMIHTKTVGSGGGVGSLNVEITINGNNEGQAGNGLIADNVAATWTPEHGGSVGNTVFSWTATTAVGIRFTSDVNLDTLSGGEWELFGVYGTLP
jgi:hypothetical protein